MPLDAATMQAHYGDSVAWSSTEHLLAGALDALNQIIWQNGDGRGTRPTPITRPGQRPAALGHTDRPTAEVRAYLDRFKPPEVSDARTGS